MKLELVKDLDAEDISKMWIQKHIDQEDTISAVVPEATYRKMLSRSKQYPLVSSSVCLSSLSPSFPLALPSL